jgi:cell wall-associated NlpC family hydrolase
MRSLVLITAVAALSSAACATSGAVPRPFPGAVTTATRTPGAPGAPSAPSALDAPIAPIAPDLTSTRFDGRTIAQFALGFRGVPYRLGGADPGGFDCSGLVQYVFAQYGVAVPRVVEEQWDIGDKIRPSDIEPGDLIFFHTNRRSGDASHVAIAIGNDSFVHAPNSTGVVRVEALSSSYWGSRYLGARRVNPAAFANNAEPATAYRPDH